MTSRRGFLMGLASALAAPAIVRAEILMPVRSIIMPPPLFISDPNELADIIANMDPYDTPLFSMSELVTISNAYTERVSTRGVGHGRIIR